MDSEQKDNTNDPSFDHDSEFYDEDKRDVEIHNENVIENVEGDDEEDAIVNEEGEELEGN